MGTCSYTHAQLQTFKSSWKRNATAELKGLASTEVISTQKLISACVCGVMCMCVCVCQSCTAGSTDTERSCLTPAMSSQRRLGYCSNEWCVVYTTLLRLDSPENKQTRYARLPHTWRCSHAYTSTHILRDIII